MSSIIISRIILTAFLAVSLSACSKDSKGSKATVRNKGGQTAGQKTAPTLDADAAKLAAEADKAAEGKVGIGTTSPKQGDDEIDDEIKADDVPAVAGSSTIAVKPMAPAAKSTTTPATTAKSSSAPVVTPAPAAKSAAPVIPTPAKPAAPAQKVEASKPAKPAAPTQTTVAKQDDKKPAAPAQTAPKKEEVKPVIESAKKEAAKPAASKPATTVASKKETSVADKAAETKRLADEKAKADAARDAARKEVVIKSEADLDKDNSSEVSLGASAYKALVDKLLAGIDMTSAVAAGVIGDEYFRFDRDVKQANSILPNSIVQQLKNSKVCDLDTTKGCLLIEVTKNNTVVASYIGTQSKYDETLKVDMFKTYRKDVLNPSATFQEEINALSKVAGGKTVVFTQAQAN